MEKTETLGKMSAQNSYYRLWHGRYPTENQFSKNRKHHPVGIQYVSKIRINKKHGIFEKSKKHSRVIIWFY